MKSWMNSPGHRSNILNRVYIDMGCGCYTGDRRYGIKWTQKFGTPQRFLKNNTIIGNPWSYP
jgi:uncharacterized protein YkwD